MEERQAKEIRRQARLGLIDPKERAMWKWANVENLDNFLNDVCYYICQSREVVLRWLNRV
jgi:autophagy-related protein 9